MPRAALAGLGLVSGGVALRALPVPRGAGPGVAARAAVRASVQARSRAGRGAHQPRPVARRPVAAPVHWQDWAHGLWPWLATAGVLVLLAVVLVWRDRRYGGWVSAGLGAVFAGSVLRQVPSDVPAQRVPRLRQAIDTERVYLGLGKMYERTP